MKRLIQEEFIEKAREVHGDKYDYSKVVYINAIIKIIIIICHKHGEFEQIPNNHLYAQGCPICRYITSGLSKRIKNNQFMLKANKLHNSKYSYSKINISGIHK